MAKETYYQRNKKVIQGIFISIMTVVILAILTGVWNTYLSVRSQPDIDKKQDEKFKERKKSLDKFIEISIEQTERIIEFKAVQKNINKTTKENINEIKGDVKELEKIRHNDRAVNMVHDTVLLQVQQNIQKSIN